MKESLKVEGMMCEACTTSVKEVLGAIKGITEVEVDLASGAVTYDIDGATTDQVKEAIEDAGFDVV